MPFQSDSVATVSTYFGRLLKGDKIAQEKQKDFSLMKLQLSGMIEGIQLEQRIEALNIQIYVIEQHLIERVQQLDYLAAAVSPESPTATTQLANFEKERNELTQMYLKKINELRKAISKEKDKLDDIRAKTKRKLKDYLNKANEAYHLFAENVVQIVNEILQASGSTPLTDEKKQELIKLVSPEHDEALDEYGDIAVKYPPEAREKMQKSLNKELAVLNKAQIEKIANFIMQNQKM